MFYDFNKSELGRIADLLNLNPDKLMERLDFQDEITILAVFEDGIKIRTKNGQEIFLTLK
jgi:hypothetical protein